MYYEHTIHMSHLGRSGTLLDPPDTYVSNPHAAALYCTLFGFNPGALYGVAQHGKGPTSQSSTHTAPHRPHPHTYHRYGERHDFQTYINLNYLLAT